MGDSLRREVLHIFKKLHRTRLKTFKDDERALNTVRDKINEEYKKYKNVTNQAAIEELNRFALEVEQEVRTNVIQAVEKEPGHFVLHLTPDTTLVDNVPFNMEAVEKSQKAKKLSNKKCGAPSQDNK